MDHFDPLEGMWTPESKNPQKMLKMGGFPQNEIEQDKSLNPHYVRFLGLSIFRRMSMARQNR